MSPPLDPNQFEKAWHQHAFSFFQQSADPLAAYIGLDGIGQYVGECGRAGSEWMIRHQHCGHAVRADYWWVMIGTGRQEPVEVADREAAIAAIMGAGAVTMKLVGP